MGGNPGIGIQLPTQNDVREAIETMFSKKSSSTNPPNSCVGFCQRTVYSIHFNMFMMVVIVLSAMTLGFEASKLYSSNSPGTSIGGGAGDRTR